MFGSLLLDFRIDPMESPQQQAPTVAPLQSHRSRDQLLGAAAALLAASVLVQTAADVLTLTDLIHTGQPVGFRIASGFGIVLDLIFVSAFGLSSTAFLSRAERRSRRLAVGATLAALGATAGLIGAALAAVTSLNHGYPSSYTTSICFVVASYFVAVLAALSAARAFSATTGSAPDPVRRECWLGWAASGLAASYGFTTLRQVFVADYFRAADASSSFTTGMDLAIFGGAVALVAGAIAAFGLRGSRRHQGEGATDWLSRRDGRLGLATGAFALASLLVGIAAVLMATSAPGNGFNSTRIAVLWLGGAAWLGTAVASACAAFGFSSSEFD
jgi:MFS family permease